MTLLTYETLSVRQNKLIMIYVPKDRNKKSVPSMYHYT